MTDASTTPSRDDYEEQYLRSARLRNPNAKTGPDEYYSVQARVIADQLVGISGMANTIAGRISLRDATGTQLDDWGKPVSEGGLGFPRPQAVGASGYLTISTVTAGTTITDNQVLTTQAGVSYVVATGAGGTYYDGQTFAVVCSETGPATNIDPGTVLTWSSPSSGCFASAVVTEQPDGSGLIGGRDAMGDDDYRELLADAQANPGTGINDAELQKQIQNTLGHGVAVKKAFTYPCCRGPGVTGWTCVLQGSAKYGSRIPTDAQLNLIAAWLEETMPSTNLLWRMPMLVDAMTFTFRVDFANNGWADIVQWPTYSGGQEQVASVAVPYYGVGAAGFTSLSSLTPVSGVTSNGYSVTVSPAGQKFYTAYPAAWGASTITLGQFVADMLPATLVTFGGVQYYLYESTNLLTYSNLSFSVDVTTSVDEVAAVRFVISSVTSATVFTVACSDSVYTLRDAPVAGQHIALFNNVTGKFVRKTIKTVSGSGPWTLTCETLANASDLTYVPVTGQSVSPWSDSLQSIADLAVSYSNGMGPGQMLTDPPGDGIRMARSPKQTQSKWPYEVSSLLEGSIAQLTSVQRVAQIEGLDYVTPAGNGSLVRQASLYDLTVYPL